MSDDILSEALECIISSAGGTECQNYTAPPYCRSEHSGRTRGAKYGADQWCATCIARHALETVHEASDEVLRIDVPEGYRIVPAGMVDRLSLIEDRARRLHDAFLRQRQAGHPVSPHAALALAELREALDGKGGENDG